MSAWRRILGRPLKASEAGSEEIGAAQGLAALSLDALSSVAYGPQAVVLVLAGAGSAALGLTLPVTAAIVCLLALLVLSYVQVIEAYPQGGGAYAVARENLGRGASLTAAAALLVDYTLTVAVSVAAGVAALTSAFPPLLPWTIPLGVLLIAALALLNLRGAGESGRAFLPPTFLWILAVFVMIAVGLLAPHTAAPPPLRGTGEAIGLLLVLRAFAAGCSALTGVEAIANGVPLFAAPAVRRARATEVLLGAILGTMLLGIALLVERFRIQPSPTQTLLSLLTAAAVGRGWLYYTVSLSTTLVLALAANTSFSGLPILASLLARDHHLPHAFALRGDRLVYNRGIAVLAVGALLLLLAVRGNTDALIPMFAIGVFTGFTLSQAGMVVHWWRQRPAGWRWRAALNGVGALATATSTLVFLATKFTSGGWLVVVVVPALLLLFRGIHRYYAGLASTLRLDGRPPVPRPHRTLVIVPVSEISRLTVAALSDALSLSPEVVAVSVQFSAEAATELEEAWRAWDPGVRLVTLHSQYRSVVRPILRFIRTLEVRAHERVLVLIPELVPRGPWRQLLHNQLGVMLAAALRARREVVVAVMPLHLAPGAEAFEELERQPDPDEKIPEGGTAPA